LDQDTLIRILESEIERTTGCTDPVSISLAVSRAVRDLRHLPDRIVVTVSPNLFKNAINVGIPGTGKRGMLWAAALGAVIDNCDAGLAILDAVEADTLHAAERLIQEGRISVGYDEDVPDMLYVKAEVFFEHEQVAATIMYDYGNIVEVSRNGERLLVKDHGRAAATEHTLTEYPVKELLALIETIDLDDLVFLVEAATVNKQAALIGLRDSHMRLGPALSHALRDALQPAAPAARAQALTAAASEARMLGLKVPVIAVTGSGNQGITDLLGVLSVAEDLGASQEKLTRALAISTVITIYVKSLTKRLTSFCGAAVAAATGVSAATVYLLGGSYTDMEHAMQSVVGTFAGILCDGAKESCAYKIGATIPIAIQFAYLALEGAYVPAGDGIIGNTIEETFKYLGRLNRPGMAETDTFMLKTIQDIRSGQDARSRHV
jgi:L-cysteine desulfidase